MGPLALAGGGIRQVDANAAETKTQLSVSIAVAATASIDTWVDRAATGPGRDQGRAIEYCASVALRCTTANPIRISVTDATVTSNGAGQICRPGTSVPGATPLRQTVQRCLIEKSQALGNFAISIEY